MKARITAPVPGLNGLGVGGLEFRDSIAETSNEGIVDYCRDAGYAVEILDDSVQVGEPLRDAAVDPGPADHLPPTHAGEADPAGPSVVAPDLEGHTPPHVEPGPGEPLRVEPEPEPVEQVEQPAPAPVLPPLPDQGEHRA